MQIRDPLLRQIEAALDRPLDGDRFEAAMCSMLRQQGIYPTLVPVRGGNDAGMDGAIGDPAGGGPPIRLICTTQEDVKANLVGSLESYLKTTGVERRVVFATSRKVTPPGRRKLEDAARTLGFTVLNIYDRAAVADLLYYSPRWCRDLLDITTARPALSAKPQGTRPFFDKPLRGRDDELAWLEGQSGDVLIVGQPGIGKTFLLMRYMVEAVGLFAVTDDVGAIDRALREEQPKVVLVSDSHAREGTLKGLRQLRSDTGGEWRIVADCWPGAGPGVQSALAAADAQVLELRPLARDIIVEIVRDIGLEGSNALLRELVDQARGRAGLAATLAWLCLRGDVRQVALGDAIKMEVESGLTALLGKEAIDALALLSLGGGSGLRLADVARELKVSELQLQRTVIGLAAGGVVEDLQSFDGTRRIAVQPAALRESLVGNRYFGEFSVQLPETLLSSAVADSFTDVLLGAARRGADVPDGLLWDRVVARENRQLLQNYAALGPKQAQRAVQAYPESLPDLAWTGLRVAPAVFLPLLFQKAVGDARSTHAATDHPLRQIEDWVHGGAPGADAIPRRRALVDAVENWLHSGGDPDTAIHAASLALMPIYATLETDPGLGSTLTVTRRVICTGELVALGNLWDRVIDIIPAQALTDWQPLLRAIHAIRSPPTLGGDPGEKFHAATRSLTSRILQRVTQAAAGQPGVLLALREIAEVLGENISAPVDSDFADLYARERYDDQGASTKVLVENMRALGQRLAAGWATEAVKLLASYDREAKKAGRSTTLLSAIGNGISEKCDNPAGWIRAFTNGWPSAEIVAPLLTRLYRDDRGGWQTACDACWREPKLRHLAVEFILSAGRLPDGVFSLVRGAWQFFRGHRRPHGALRSSTAYAFRKGLGACCKWLAFWRFHPRQVWTDLSQYAGLVNLMCQRGQVSTEVLAKLLVHRHDGVAAAAAAGEWHAVPRGKVRAQVLDIWRPAMLRCGSKEQRSSCQLFIRDILEADADLAFDWFVARIRGGESLFYAEHHDLQGAVAVLSGDQRLAVLLAMAQNQIFNHDELVARLVNGDPVLYRRLLAEPKAKRLHLNALAGRPSATWIAMAVAALDSGYGPEDIRQAAERGVQSWSGPDSDHWESWRKAWEAIEVAAGDPRVKDLAKRGVEVATLRRNTALKLEKTESIYGTY